MSTWTFKYTILFTIAHKNGRLRFKSNSVLYDVYKLKPRK